MELLLGWIANGFFVAGGFFKKPRTTMLFYGTGNLFYIIMYCVLGTYVPALAVGIVLFRNVSAVFLSDRQNRILQHLLTALFTLLFFFTIKSYLDVMILTAGWCIAAACFAREDFLKFRFYNTVSQCLWIVHSVIFGVWPMVFASALILMTNLYAVLKYSSFFQTYLTQMLPGLAVRINAKT